MILRRHWRHAADTRMRRGRHALLIGGEEDTRATKAASASAAQLVESATMTSPWPRATSAHEGRGDANEQTMPCFSEGRTASTSRGAAGHGATPTLCRARLQAAATPFRRRCPRGPFHCFSGVRTHCRCRIFWPAHGMIYEMKRDGRLMAARQSSSLRELAIGFELSACACR